MIIHPKLSSSLDYLYPIHEDTLHAWRNSPEVFKWCRQNDLITTEGHAKWFKNHQTDPKVKMYLIRAKKQDPAGVCGFTDIDLINQRAEFSLYIAPEKQKQGIGKDALKLLIWHGFNAYPFETIWGESFSGNPAIEMFKSIGFKQEGIRRGFYFRDGVYVDAHLFSIKREELVI